MNPSEPKRRRTETEPLSAYACPICFSAPTNATLTPCGHICCGPCLFTAIKSTLRRNVDRAPTPRCVCVCVCLDHVYDPHSNYGCIQMSSVSRRDTGVGWSRWWRSRAQDASPVFVVTSLYLLEFTLPNLLHVRPVQTHSTIDPLWSCIGWCSGCLFQQCVRTRRTHTYSYLTRFHSLVYPLDVYAEKNSAHSHH